MAINANLPMLLRLLIKAKKLNKEVKTKDLVSNF